MKHTAIGCFICVAVITAVLVIIKKRKAFVILNNNTDIPDEIDNDLQL